MNINDKISDILASPSVSRWMKESLRTALERDCSDAAADAEYLAMILSKRADEILGRKP